MAEGQHHMHKRTPNQTRQGAVSGLCSVEGAACGYYAAGERREVHAGGWMEGGGEGGIEVRII